MPNKDMPAGARPKGQVLRASTYTTSSIVYPGDFVELVNDGTIAAADAGSQLVGVALGYAASGGQCLVADDPAQRFIAQADDATIDAATDLNLNYNFLATGGSTLYKMSRMEIDSSTQATDSNLPLKVVKVYPAINNALGANVECEFIINNHAYKGGTGNLGV
jgi:hypothetical protein